MADLRPFHAVRPAPQLAQSVVAPPYDVVDVDEARALARGNPLSFLHVSRPEIDLAPWVDPHAEEVHAQGRRALDSLLRESVLVRDDQPSLMIYRQRLGAAEQVGVVGCATVADYLEATIATHEHTRPDRQADRAQHISTLDAHDEPVLLMHPGGTAAAAAVRQLIREVIGGEQVVAEAVTPDGTTHTLWLVPAHQMDALIDAFAAMPRMYVADGHHRSAAAADVAAARGSIGDAGQFPAVVFPADELTVLAYNRVVADLDGLTADAFLDRLRQDFDLTPVTQAVSPATQHTIGVYLHGRWYRATLRPGRVDQSDPIARLDVSVLSDFVLGPVLGIRDQRTDKRIAFVGGSRGTAELERLVASEQWAVAFSLYPTSPADVIAVSDQGEVMPPKSTWFEPKLASGLFVHQLS